ncbi:MAG: DOMON-like domain-containing protein [Deltaproteobacteria bacterium]|nr:DOMON-like domain-containing protein [Deltaproteobacteria bacterium]
MLPIELSCHPSTPTRIVRSVVASAQLVAHDLTLSFRLAGDFERIRIPRPTESRVKVGLWEHTCFEAFVRRDGSTAYHEINLSPSGEWAVFSFLRYREIVALPEDLAPPIISTTQQEKRLQLEARIDLSRLAEEYRTAGLRLALAAVIEDVDGSLSYWAVQHAPGKPDFHHADAFALQIPGS